jgi:hypothetical protein
MGSVVICLFTLYNSLSCYVGTPNSCLKAFGSLFEIVIVLVLFILSRSRFRRHSFHTSFFVILIQSTFVSLACHDLVPYIPLEKKNFINLDKLLTYGFLAVIILFPYDFKYTICFMVPVFMSNSYFSNTGISKIIKELVPDNQSDDELKEFV